VVDGVLDLSSTILSIWGSTRAVCVAVVTALAILWTSVPAGTLGHFLGQLAHLGLCVKHVALGTTKLVWLLIVIAGEVVLAVSGMSIDGVSLQQVLGSDGVPATGASEAVHLQKFLGVVADSRQFALLLGTNTGADFHIKDEGVWAGELKGPSVVALDVLVAYSWVVVVKDSICLGAFWVRVGTGFLDELAISTVDVVRKDTLLMVHPCDVKEQALGAVFYCGNTFSADVKEIALLGIRELSIVFGADEVLCNVPVLLAGDSDGQEEDGGKVGADHVVAEAALAPTLLSLAKVSDQDVGAAAGALCTDRR